MRHTAEPHNKSKESDDHNNGHLELYKTELCRTFLEKGSCRYGTKCQFAHGIDELRTVQRHPRYKTEICKSYHSMGTCKYGHRCRFIHISPEEDIRRSLGLGSGANLEALHQKVQENQKNLGSSTNSDTPSGRKKSVSSDMDPGSVPFAPINDKDRDKDKDKNKDKDKEKEKEKDNNNTSDKENDKDKESQMNETPERSRSSFSPNKFKKDRFTQNSSPITSPEHLSYIQETLSASTGILPLDFSFTQSGSEHLSFEQTLGSPSLNDEQTSSPLGTIGWIENQQPSTSPLITNNIRSTAGSSFFMNHSNFNDFQNSPIESASISLLTDLNQSDDLSSTSIGFGFDGGYKNEQNNMLSLLPEMNFNSNNNLLFPDIKQNFLPTDPL